MHDANANGGPVIDMGVHLFDGWALLFDSEPVEVFAQGHRLAAGRPEISHIAEVAIDTATVLVRYASGDTGTFVCSWGLPPGVIPPGGPDTVFGPAGALQLTYGSTHQEARWLREGGEWETIAVCDEDMYQREIASFARCIIEDRPPVAGGAEGRAALRVALAAIESIRVWQACHVGLNGISCGSGSNDVFCVTTEVVVRHGKEFRNKVFSMNPAFRYLPESDRYLFALEQPKYRFNVIGSGLNGMEHIRVTQMEGRATIHGVFDTSPLSVAAAKQALAQFAPGANLIVYDSLEAACNDPAVDGLVICTPNFSHIDIVRVAAKSGKHILLEKPMATTIPDAYEIAQTAKGYSGDLPDRPAISLQADLRGGDPRGAGTKDDRRHQDHHDLGAPLPLPGQSQTVEQVL